jgi:transposase-like protein
MLSNGSSHGRSEHRLALGATVLAAFRGRCPRPPSAGRGEWRVDETYCRLNDRWAYCYRAIDQEGQVVDVYFSIRRNAAAAQTFFERAISPGQA